MTGTLPWNLTLSTINVSSQTITANTETVVATLTPVQSVGSGVPIYLTGQACFVVQAATTITNLRIRQDSLTGTIVGVAQPISSAAGDVTGADASVAGVFTPPGEVAGKTFVLTVQATNAGANWNVTLATLFALQ